MDLVKIGFQINANGLKDANTEVDKLLGKVDNIGTKGKKASSEFENSQKKVQDSVKKTEKVSTSASDKMIQKQQTINQLLPYMDKGVANLASSFWLVSKEAQSFNKYLDLLESNKAITEQKKQVEGLAKEQAKASASEEVARQRRLLAEQNYYQKVQEQARKTANKELDSLQKSEASAESLRQKKLLSEQNYYLRVQEEAKKASAKEQESLKKIEVEQEALRQKRLLSEQNYYLKTQEEAKKAVAKEKALQQKAIDDAEKTRQQSLLRVQNNYIKQQEAIAKAQQKAVDKQVASQNTLNESNQKAITLEQTRAKYISQGFGKNDATRISRMEISGADSSTLDNYKRAIEETNKAAQALNSTHGNFLAQVKGIAIYAALSAAIYGVMTAMTSVAVSTVKMADEYTSTQQRLKLYIKDAQTLGEVNTFLAKSAIQNNVGLRENAALYAKLAPAMQRIGANTAATNQVVDAFGKSLRIGGATAMEAASATTQFAQAMASGKLAGDEFRAISEASPRFLKAIADGSGIAAEKLKEMSAAGALTTEVIARALVKEYHNLTLESASLGYTLDQGTNALKTGFMSLVGEFNEGAGITKMLGSFMAGLGVSMIDSANSAKESGEAFSLWFTRNAERIEMFGEALKVALSTFIAFKTTAMVLSGWTALTTAIVAARSATVGMTASMIAFNLAARATGASVAFLSNTLKFFGGWVGLILTAASAILTYVGVNKMMGDSTEETTKSLEDQGETIQQVVDKYKTLTKMQQEKALLDARNQVQANTEAYSDQKDALVGLVSRMRWSNEMTGQQSDVLDKLVTWYKTGKITLEQFNGAVLSQASLTQKSKDEVTVYGNKVKDAETAAKNATDKVTALTNATKGSGDAAAIASGQFGKFLTDAETQININKLAAQYMVKHNLDQAKAVDLAKQALALQAQKKDITPAEIKSQQELLKSEQDMAAVTSARTEAEKKLNKEKKDDDKDLKKFSNMKLEAQTYYDVLQKVNNLDVARIASQKEYINIYKDNLAVATELANIQEMTRKEENRQEYNKSLRDQVEQLSVIAGLTEAGADYETAKALAAAGFVNDAKGRAAAEKTIMNTLTGQSFALSDQITDQETLNRYLKEGMGLEEARFKVALSRIAKLSGGKNVFGTFGEDFENAMKLLRETRATEASQQKINALNREAALLTTSMAFSYTAASLAAAKLSASTQGLLYSQAETQLTKQNEVDLLTEQYEISLKISSLLSQDSEVMRDIKSQYPAILGVDAQRLETARKLLEITEAYSAKQQEQKKNPVGDFSNVDFEVFGDFGNPFKEALNGLNALVGGSGQLESKLALVAAKIEDLKTQSFVEEMFGNTDAVNNITTEIEKQLGLGKDLQEQKVETNDIAYGQGLKLAKSFFKEGSKGYKVISGLEMALQAKQIAFQMWKNREKIKETALELWGYAKSAASYVTTTATKVAAEGGLNIVKGIGAILSGAQQPGPLAFAGFAAMAALVAGLGIAVSGGGSSGSFAPTNEGTGTVFGDSEAQSESIKNSIDLLSENSDLMLPLTSAMLASLRNIESSLGGVTNLIIRGDVGNIASGLEFDAKFTGMLGKVQGFVGKVESFADKISLGKMLGFDVRGVVSGLASSIVGGLFGKTSATVVGSGLTANSQSLGNILNGGLNLQQYADIATTKKSWFSKSTTNSTQYASASQELENQFGLIFTGFYDSIVSASGALSANTEEVKKKLQDAIINIGKIDLKGLKGDEIQEKLEAIFGAAADSLAQQGFAGLDDFQKVGEGYYETLVRVASSVEQASYYTEKLNVQAIKYTDILNKQGDVAAEIVRQSVLLNESTKDIKGGFYDLVNSFDGNAEEITDFVFTLRDLQDQLFMTGKDTKYLTTAMILGAGGLDKLSSGFDAYFEMLSPAEQAAELTRRLTNEFAIFGKELPSDVKAFRNLVSSIDITTGAGQKLYGQILALAPEFNDLQDALESTNSDVNALVQSLRDLAEQARAARGETEQPRNLAYTRSQFESNSILAMQGDTKAAEKLLTLGKDLMGLSKTYSVTGSEYARDLALIQRAATVSADIQEQGLGTSISTALTPSSGSTTTPTVNTNTTSTDARLDALSEKLEAGLFAIAKYTQDSASRLERWDDGSRMMVGIQPENGDAPVPVVVTP